MPSMFSVKLKPALVSVIVTAGLLAAAAPASAQLNDLTQTPNAAGVGLQAPKPSVVDIDLNDPFFNVVGGIVPGGAIISAKENRSRADQTMPLFWQGNLVNPTAVQDADMEI